MVTTSEQEFQAPATGGEDGFIDVVIGWIVDFFNSVFGNDTDVAEGEEGDEGDGGAVGMADAPVFAEPVQIEYLPEVMVEEDAFDTGDVEEDDDDIPAFTFF